MSDIFLRRFLRGYRKKNYVEEVNMVITEFRKAARAWVNPMDIAQSSIR